MIIPATIAERDGHAGPAVSSPARPLPPEAVEFVHSWGHRVGIQIWHQNREAAYDTVAAGLEERRAKTVHPLLEMPLTAIGVEVRPANLLEKHLGITTVEGLLNTTGSEMLTVPNFGHIQAYEAMAALLRYSVKRVIELEAAGK